MSTTRRQFIKQSAKAVSLSLIAPRLVFARRREANAPDPNRRILVVIQLAGGNDGLNTVIPYSDPRYQSLRPLLAFKEEELKDENGKPTILNNEFALHPALGELKEFYEAGKLAIVQGAGYADANLSHGVSTDIWATGNVNGGGGLGWLGRYADEALVGKGRLSEVAVSYFFPRATRSSKVYVPTIPKVGEALLYTNVFTARNNFLNSLNVAFKRDFPEGSFVDAVARVSREANQDTEIQPAVLAAYRSSVIYPDDNPFSLALKTVAQLAVTFPEANVFHLGASANYDTHSSQIGTAQDGYRNRLKGVHYNALRRLSKGIRLFYDDLLEQGLADNVLMMTYSEFGRRPNDNASSGTDHGTASNLLVMGNQVKGGDLYGLEPSLKVTDLDIAGNMRFTTDFRSVYATVLDKWLGTVESQRILGAQFPHIGFL